MFDLLERTESFPTTLLAPTTSSNAGADKGAGLTVLGKSTNTFVSNSETLSLLDTTGWKLEID